MNWIEINTETVIKKIKEESFNSRVLLFKYNEESTINMLMKWMLERNWNDGEMENIKTYILNVPAHSDISDKIVTEYGVAHESPQVLIISKGECIYNASHGNVVYSELRKVFINEKVLSK